MKKLLNNRINLFDKTFLFFITTLSVFIILIPRTFFGFDLTDTFFALELQVLLERNGPVYWNYIFLTNYIGLLWMKLCPVNNLFWWCHLGGVLTISLASGLSSLIVDKLLNVSHKIIWGTVVVATVMVSWANCSMLINYYTVPTLILTLLLYLVLFIRPDRWCLFFVIGVLSAAEIGSRWPTAILLIIPPVYIVFRKLTDPDFRLIQLKKYWPALVVALTGFMIGTLAIYGLMRYYNVFERNPSGVHRGFEYAFYYLRIYIMNFPLVYACLLLWAETAIKRWRLEMKRATLLDIVIALIALSTFAILLYFQIKYIVKGVYWDAAYTCQHFLYATVGYYILLRFVLACGIIKQIMQKLSDYMPCSIPLLEKKDCFGDGMDIIFKFTHEPYSHFLAYVFTYIVAGIIFPFGSDGIYYYNYCMLPLIWAICLIGIYQSRYLKKLFYYRTVMILLLLCSGLGLTFFATYRDGALHKLTANFKTSQLNLLHSTPQRVENIDRVLAYLNGKISNSDTLLVIGQESFFYFYLPGKPWEQWVDYQTLSKRLLHAREMGIEKLPHYILISLAQPEYPDTGKMTAFVQKYIAQNGVYQQVYCDKGYLVYKRLK